ncbi:very-short-patch-repair endonuclease [Elusimicrobium simillimum]|uniref:endonuclease domain-containing protein n=1 Tax=Elusimicrobium simillimum TaxID=3143438 RepID=UPI003C6FA24E
MPTPQDNKLSEFAKNNRKIPTMAENKLWQILRNRSLESKFRRQQKIGPYIVDFVCFHKTLIIECDGGQHSKEVDSERTKYLESEGYKILRFWNNEILSNIEAVWTVIKKEID